ncbi:3-hydroxyacyl-CoA dehydrogenase [Actinotalea ferrariae]|nr:3-hydroxyacyl-CoA dehydrogenase [Actinotalea ferrariae]
MGAGIAQVAALAGHRVLLLDAASGRAAAAVADVGRALDRLVARGRVDADRADAARERLAPAASIADLADCVLVVEAAAEQLDVKQQVMAALEDVVAPTCVLATNTSSLSITDVAAGMRHPGRLVGMHFFNPAPAMRLVEVVSGTATDPDVAARVAALATAWGKTPVQVASSPGFVVNRVARPFYGEALAALEEDTGLDAATVDAVLREAGRFPMGPLELTDLIGQDVNLATSRSVWEQLGRDPRYAPSRVQEALVEAGTLGRKTGRGFYRHDDGSPRPRPSTAPPAVAPEKVVVRGDWGPWTSLWERVEEVGVGVLADARPGPRDAHRFEPVAEVDGGLLVPTDGRTAADRAAAAGVPVVVLDLALDPRTATRFAVAASPGCPREVLDAVVGLLQATGAAVTVLPDRPGLLVARTVAVLVDEAAAVADEGIADPADVDTALRLGAGYPLGPLEWGDRTGPARVAAVLDAVAAATGSDRYRVSPALRRASTTGGALRGH